MRCLATANLSHWFSMLVTCLVAAVVATPLVADCADFGSSSERMPIWFARNCALDGDAPDAPMPERNLQTKAGSDTAYALNLWGGFEFLSHPVSSMSVVTPIDVNSTFITGFDFSADLATLYAINREANLFGTIDLADGSFTSIAAFSPPLGEVWVSLVVDPSSDTTYAISLDEFEETSTLLTVDRASGAQTVVGTIDADILAASMNCSGKMYGVSLFTNSLFEINPSTGAATLIGPLGFDLNFAQEIDFDNDTGVLYHWLHDFSDGGKYGTIDLTTGAFSQIDDLGSTDEFIGSIQNGCAPIFTDGFESGDTSFWDAVTP